MPGNLAKIITTPADFPKQSLCLPVIPATRRPQGCDIRSLVETQARPGLGCRLRHSCPLQFPGNQRPHDPGQKARDLEPKGCGLEGVGRPLVPACASQRSRHHPLPLTRYVPDSGRHPLSTLAPSILGGPVSGYHGSVSTASKREQGLPSTSVWFPNSCVCIGSLEVSL